MRIRLLSMLAAAALLCAQEKPGTQKPTTPEPEKLVTRIIQVHYVNVNHLRDLLGIPGVYVKADSDLHVLAVTGYPDTVQALEDMAKKLDVAPPPPPARPNIDLTVYILGADAKTRGDEVPADLSATVRQLHQLFPYKGYRVLDTFVLRGRDGESGSTSGSIGSAADGTPTLYTFRYNKALVGEGTPRTIRLNDLQMNIRAPYTTQPVGTAPPQKSYLDSGIRTDLDIREGQKVVVGKSTYGAENPFILAVTAKVVE